MMKTPYDILGVHRNASNETIRAAFRRTAKACHPDLNPGDRSAQQRLMQVIAAYRILKGPQQRAAYDQYLRTCRRARTRRFAADGVAALVGAGIASLAVWLWVSPSNVVTATGIELVNQRVARRDDTGVRHYGDSGRKNNCVAALPDRRLPDDSAQQLQQSASIQQPAVGSAESPALL